MLYEYLKHAVGIAPNEIVVINKDHPEEIAREESLEQEGEVYTAKLDDAEYKDQKEIKVDSLYGDKYNENMLKTIETRKYEFAKEGK